MRIVIPMSGYGERFRRAGVTVPKPLVSVEGAPMIQHVVDLFPGEARVLFICNREHLEHPGYRLAETLEAICPSAEIAAIAPHDLGPVYAVDQVADRLDPDEPAVVNYCDFTCTWDWAHFRRFVAETGCDGAIATYSGFHPHTLWDTHYGYVRERAGRVDAVREKRSFTASPRDEPASSGTYYFARGADLVRSFRGCLERGLSVGGEFYVSLAYQLLLEAGADIRSYPLQHFAQWGTPEDLADYRYHSDAFRALATPRRRARQPGTVAVLAAGAGARFAAAGYDVPKPLAPVSGAPLLLQSLAALPAAEQRLVLLRRDMVGYEALAETARRATPPVEVVTLPTLTAGQALTARAALEAAPDGMVTCGACDYGALYDPDALERLLADPSVDAVVWTARGYPAARRAPHRYGWVEVAAGGVVRGVSVKRPLADPAHDPIILGAFTFRRRQDFLRVIDRLVARDERVGGELYLDSCLEDALALGLSVRAFDVAHYLGWGTPDELLTFEYWQSFFHKWPAHPYRLERDPAVSPAAAAALAERYRHRPPEIPAR